MPPKLSIVMAVFNEEETIKESVQSILNQNFKDFELIVVDDGSQDQTITVLNQNFEDERIRIIEQANLGLTKALIAGCESAEGKYIARHDCGDQSDPARFSKQLKVLDSFDEVSLCSTSTCFYGPNKEKLFTAKFSGTGTIKDYKTSKIIDGLVVALFLL